MMSDDPTRSLVLVLRPDGEPEGAGFLVSARCIMSCCHVWEKCQSDGSAWVSFPLLPGNPRLRACLLREYPYREGARTGDIHDIALLTLSEPPPQEAVPAKLSELAEGNLSGISVEMYGFPYDLARGHWVDGVVQRRVEDARVQLKHEGARTVVRGFSGGLAWHAETRAVVGMITDIYEGKTAAEAIASYMIPAADLARVLRENQINTPSELSSQVDRMSHINALRPPCKVFISYCREDIDTAMRLYRDLKEKGFEPWMDKVDILPGERWKIKIKAAIRDSDYFIALLSKSALTKRGYVQKELKKALDILEEFPDEHIFLLPVRIEPCRPENETLLDINWADLFPSYEDGFAKILKTLNAARPIDSDVKELKEPIAIKDDDPESIEEEEKFDPLEIKGAAKPVPPPLPDNQHSANAVKIVGIILIVLLLSFGINYMMNSSNTTTPLRRVSSINIDTNPRGAAIFIDEQNWGITPVLLEGIPSGDIKVKAELDGYEPAQSQILLKPGTNPSKTIDLKPLPGKLDLSITPSDANVRFVNSSLTYKNGMRLVPGTYALKISKDEYVDEDFTFEIKPGSTFSKTIQMKQIPKKRPIIQRPPGMEFVLIKAGTFMMGSPSSEPKRDDDEKLHKVTLTKDFYMQTTEVTQGQWKAVMGENPSFFKACGDDCPVEQVSWEDAQEFIRRLKEIDPKSHYRLPTEAEWEYACRAGSSDAFANGGITETECQLDQDLDKIGWYCGNADGKTHTVGRKAPNDWGLFDMSGNLWEWCQDWYGSYPDGPVVDPTGPPNGSSRVVRGGSWDNYARYCRCAFRGSAPPGDRSRFVGFRLARSLP